MAALRYKDEHNKVDYLLKPTGSDDYHQIIDFLSASYIRAPELGPSAILATIDKTPYTITKDLVRSRLQLADDGGKLTFFKNKFSPQWRFLVHTLLHCLSTKSGSWDQFGSPIAIALIYLSDGRRFNWSNYIFKGMISNIGNDKKFLMYPRFLQTILGIETRVTRQYKVLVFSSKLFANMRLNFVGHPMPLLPAMLLQAQAGEGAEKVYSLESELQAHKKLFKDVVGKLVKKVKTLEVKLKTKKRKLVVSDSDQEDSDTQNVDLDALHALANAAVTVDLDIPSGSTLQIPAASQSVPIAGPPGTFGVPTGTFSVPLGASNVPTGASTVPTSSPTVPMVVPSRADPTGVSSKGKSLMVKEDIPVRARTFKQMEEDRLGEKAAKRLHDEEMAQMERERAEVQRKRQQEVLDSAMYYNESDWLNIRAQVKANASLFKTLLGDDVSENNFPARMAALIKKKRQALAKQLFKESQIQAFSQTLKRPGPVLEEPSCKRLKSPEAPTPSMPEVPISPAVSSPPSSRLRRKSLGRKHMHKPKSTLTKLDLDAPAQTFIKVVVNEDSDNEDSNDEVWSAVVGWEVLPTPLGENNALYCFDGSTKHFTTLCQILYMVDRQDLVKLYGLVGKGFLCWTISKSVGDKKLEAIHSFQCSCFGNCVWYVVPTGRVIVPTGRYIVPIGRVIVATGRLGHLNFKTMNKLVKGNLVRGLPSNLFENDQACVACQKGKQDIASYHLGKFDGKVDEDFFVGYSLNSKAFRVFNSRTKIVEENLHIRFSESTLNVVGSGPDWLFDIDALTRTTNYEPIVTSIQSNGFADPRKKNECNDQEKKDNVKNTNNVNTVSLIVNAASTNEDNELPFDPNMPALEDVIIFNFSNDDEDEGIVADMNNLGTTIQIEEEVYVCQPPRFEDQDFPYRVYKVEKALYRIHQAPRAWYETLSTNLLDDGFERGKIDKTLFIKRHKGDILLMSSMGELTFFLGLQVKQKKDGIFINQDKYVAEILKKFWFIEGKTTSTPQNPLLKDEDGKEVDVHMYRSMIGSLMYLTSSRLDIMFAVCVCARYQVNLKVSHLSVVKRIFRYLKGQLKLIFWYPKDSPFDLVAYIDSDYARASLDRNSTTGGYKFLGCRIISWQYKKQTVVANSITEAEYIDDGKAFWNGIRVNTTSSKLMLLGITYYCRVNVNVAGDGKKITITEASIRRDLQLADEEGVDCLPNSTIFELALMGPKTTAWNEFSSNVASAIICLATNQKLNFSKWIFDSMIRNLDNMSGKFWMYPRVTPLFPTMVIQNQSKLGEGSAMPTNPYHTPTILQSSLSQPQKTHKPRKPTRKVTQVPRNLRDTTAQTRFESVAKHSNDSLLARGNTLQSDEDKLELNELMALCPNLQKKVIDLEKTNTTQSNEISSLKRMVKKLEKKNRSRTHKLKRLYKLGMTARVESSKDEESLVKDASKQERRIDIIC
uniref:Reverse transcriptase Ty1/copia-type domain-containing protein n=1 Tax=Tanacetum cinerariifolium TaxID=118510 RepID=A0A6L2KTR5_TANCI|nr:hypothetical protein [Tanacetum cinerariifolium]